MSQRRKDVFNEDKGNPIGGQANADDVGEGAIPYLDLEYAIGYQNGPDDDQEDIEAHQT
jgi:hypothetical protein